jgi:hypothetical protein
LQPVNAITVAMAADAVSARHNGSFRFNRSPPAKT